MQLASLPAHLLFAYVLLIEPLLGARMYNGLRRALPYDGGARARFYRLGIAIEWCWVAVVLVVVAVSGVTLGDLGLDLKAPGAEHLGFVAAVMLGGLVPVVVFALRSMRSGQPSVRESLRRMMEPFSALLPSTTQERWLFAALAVTAGICEEIVFRGFLILYLSNVLAGLPVVWSAAVSSVIFGVCHWYQGLGGVVQTTAIGGLMAFLYLSSGSLLLPIILHALIDLRILALYRPDRREGSAT